MEPERAAGRPLLHATVVLLIEVLLVAVTWFVLGWLGQPRASFTVTMTTWSLLLVLYAAPVQAAIAARSRSGQSLTLYLFLVGLVIWGATATTHLPAMFPLVMGIAALELTERDSSWRTAGLGVFMTLAGAATMSWFVATGQVPSAFSSATNVHLTVLLALMGCVLIVRGVGRARVAVALRNELAEAQSRRDAELHHAATHDALTGTLSRGGLGGVLAGPVGRSPGLAVIYLDLDGFKAINDEHGHGAGDALLVKVAERFAEAVPGEGVLARMGGDEFVVVVPQMPSAEAASSLADQLQDCLNVPLEIPSGDCAVVVSVGVSAGMSWSAEPAADPEALMREADMGMYENKRSSQLRVRRRRTDRVQPPAPRREGSALA
ncbi:GGDEF domain-containing protein [Kineosporia babensis]|uniref:GGDEF domain-containing protein n=1 Tax=Kineosporia babensis TaxID=499548 RepID=A0A9X1SUC6_9ACTN|nr:GGDEF domain-containing protein [Kineosporia babensis]MCD5312759.1 GGDEF domain-containing protein [Kineosporia babensis]